MGTVYQFSAQNPAQCNLTRSTGLDSVWGSPSLKSPPAVQSFISSRAAKLATVMLLWHIKRLYLRISTLTDTLLEALGLFLPHIFPTLPCGLCSITIPSKMHFLTSWLLCIKRTSPFSLSVSFPYPPFLFILHHSTDDHLAYRVPSEKEKLQKKKKRKKIKETLPASITTRPLSCRGLSHTYISAFPIQIFTFQQLSVKDLSYIIQHFFLS